MALSPEDRERAEEIFFEYLESGETVDEIQLIERCGGDTAIAAEVLELLDSHTEAAEILPETESTTPDQQAHIGPYRILSELGRGGMGTVHLAERTGDYHMEVAIKVLPPGLAGTAARERFVAERRILAKLEHPGIARLLDGGWTGDGRPYIVMERVDGVPISAFVQDLEVNDRLGLFLQVAQAVQFAHRHLVVHRDLKPSNILVTPEGRVKLLDFGIAKLLDEDESTESLTRTGERLLTPDYASPEQIRGEAVTTASDVYQLGVVLYEMLTGVVPFRLKGRSLVEVERTVSDTVPKVPSVRVGEETGELDGRRTARALRGDLDNIIMKALRKEPEARYASPEAMAADVQRHLDGLPVTARGGTRWYVIRKFVRRHRVSVGAAVLLLVSLLGFSLISLQQARTIARERDRVAIERDNARRVVSFMVGLFERAKPENDQGRDITVREVLNVGAMQIQMDLEETPEARASFMNVIGSAFGIIGDRQQGETLLKQALAIRLELDSLSLDAAETMNDLGVVQLRANRVQSADSLLSRALSIRSSKGASLVEVATTRLNLAIVRERQRRFAEADSLYRQALPVFRRGYGVSHDYWAVATNNLALLRRATGDLEEAERLLLELLPVRREHADVAPGPLALTLTNLGTVLHERQRHAEAVPLLREAVELFTTQANARPREAAARQNLAAALGAMGQREEAELQFRRALEAREAMYGPDDVRVAVVLNNIASMWQRADQPGRAEPDFRRAVQIARNDPNATWGLRGQLEVNWAWSLLRTGRYSESGTVFRGLLAAAEELSERIVLDTHWGLARCLAETGDPAGAEQQFDLALERVDAVLPAGDANRWKLRLQKAEFLRAQNRGPEAIPLLALAADSLRASGPEVADDAEKARRLLAQLRAE